MRSPARLSSGARVAALGAYGALLALTAPAWPDDWDGIGFVESVRHFDMARFQPHPPGYPVYVALLKSAALVTRDPLRACVLVAVASGVLAVAFTWGAVRAIAGERAAWLAAILVGAAPLAWRSCSGVGSEGPALGCLAALAWGLGRAWQGQRPAWTAIAIGAGAGLGLGVRLSWAPLFVAGLLLAPRGSRLRAWVASAVSTTAWALPFTAIVGPSRLFALYATHLVGHAQRWGGTVTTEPGVVRLAWLARDVFVDGLGVGPDPLGIALALVLAFAAVHGLVTWRSAGWPVWKAVLAVVAPYVTWIALEQNLRDQPRHALPLVVLLSAALALPVATGSRRAFALVGSLALLMATRTAFDAHARRTIPPPGEQLLELARRQADPDRLDVFGVSSVRFFELGELADHAFTAGSLGDVQGRLARVDRLPSRVWVTSEVEGREASPWPLLPVATLCRPPRIDRRAPCLDVSSWKLPYLR